VTVASFAKLLSQFGKLARPHAHILIRIQKEYPTNTSWYYALLRDVGGDEVIAHLFEVLPRVSAEVAKIKADPNVPRGFLSDDARGWWFDCLREIQLACDRWAGRRFDTDAERLTWWQENRRRSRSDWLAENLEIVVKQADSGEPWARWVANEVLPDLPKPPSDPHRIGDRTMDPSLEPDFRTKWLVANRPRLKYDPISETFRLVKGQ
jgi:hypothetical protein